MRRILLLHSRYRQGMPSGENVAVDLEVRALRSAGYDVRRLEVSSDEIVDGDRPRSERLRAVPRLVWNRRARRSLTDELAGFRPDVVHLHNDFPLLGPGIHHLLGQLDVDYFQSIHNYRFSCIDASLFRDGRFCDDCVGHRLPTPGLVHRCGGSAARSAYVAGWTVATRALRDRASPTLIANSRYVADTLVAQGAQRASVTHRYNLAWPRPSRIVSRASRRDVVAAGRLDAAKGMADLVEVWLRRPPTGVHLVVLGDGPEFPRLAARTADRPDVHLRGSVPQEQAVEAMAGARLVVVPSRWAEPFGRVAMEAMHHGTPVLTTDVGGLPEVVRPTLPGHVVAGGDTDALEQGLWWALDTPDVPAPDEIAAHTEERFGLAAFLERTERIYEAHT